MTNAFVKGIQVPLAINREDQGLPPYVLLLDGVLSAEKRPSYEWEVKLHQYFDRSGVPYSPVFTAQWWKSPRLNIKKLAQQMWPPTPPSAETNATPIDDLALDVPESPTE
ncbi:MAG: hypothetical protein IPL65_03455 [Lewinellaceae bacterium]|nr:hypothetical protein [Lewinellaceae bacterium]